MIDTFISQLEAYRTSIILQLQLVDGLIGQLTKQPINPEECQHPDEHRLNLTVMGGPRSWLCKLCNHEHRGSEQ